MTDDFVIFGLPSSSTRTEARGDGVFGNKCGRLKLGVQTCASIRSLFCKVSCTHVYLMVQSSVNKIHQIYTYLEILNEIQASILWPPKCIPWMRFLSVGLPLKSADSRASIELYHSGRNYCKADHCSPRPFNKCGLTPRSFCKVKQGASTAQFIPNFAENEDPQILRSALPILFSLSLSKPLKDIINEKARS